MDKSYLSLSFLVLRSLTIKAHLCKKPKKANSDKSDLAYPSFYTTFPGITSLSRHIYYISLLNLCLCKKGKIGKERKHSISEKLVHTGEIKASKK